MKKNKHLKKSGTFFLCVTTLVFSFNKIFAQNSMTGDGFGGRSWYVAHNYQVGAYSAFTVCGSDHQLYSWGGNNLGELGNGTFNPSTFPTLVLGMTNVKFYTTGYVSAVIKEDSTAWIWGKLLNSVGDLVISPTPAQILSNVKFADGGATHVVFVKNDSTAWAAGQNGYGQLGDGTIVPPNNPTAIPVQMTGINNAVRAVAIGYSWPASMILLGDGTVKLTGGYPWFSSTDNIVPVTVAGLNNIIDIKGNAIAAYALNYAGEVYSFGRTDANGALGLGSGIPTNQYIPPTKINFPAGAAPIIAISANDDGYSALALDENKNVYAWGDNINGQLGDNTTIDRKAPVLVATNVIDIYAGETFSYILKADSSLWATGRSGGSNPGSIWMNLSNVQRNVFTQIDPQGSPMNLCAPFIYGVVPVRLIEFNCRSKENLAILNWVSAEESNLDRYIIQCAENGINFQYLATMTAKGAGSNYNYQHEQVVPSAYYRLQMIDKDGKFQYSEIRKVKLDDEIVCKIIPNPTKGRLHIYSRANRNITSLQLLSIDRKLLKTFNKYISGEELDISSFSDGIYILKVTYLNNKVSYQKIVKF